MLTVKGVQVEAELRRIPLMCCSDVLFAFIFVPALVCIMCGGSTFVHVTSTACLPATDRRYMVSSCLRSYAAEAESTRVVELAPLFGVTGEKNDILLPSSTGALMSQRQIRSLSYRSLRLRKYGSTQSDLEHFRRSLPCLPVCRRTASRPLVRQSIRRAISSSWTRCYDWVAESGSLSDLRTYAHHVASPSSPGALPPPPHCWRRSSPLDSAPTPARRRRRLWRIQRPSNLRQIRLRMISRRRK